jgi:hypothetical protein
MGNSRGTHLTEKLTKASGGSLLYAARLKLSPLVLGEQAPPKFRMRRLRESTTSTPILTPAAAQSYAFRNPHLSRTGLAHDELFTGQWGHSVQEVALSQLGCRITRPGAYETYARVAVPLTRRHLADFDLYKNAPLIPETKSTAALNSLKIGTLS